MHKICWKFVLFSYYGCAMCALCLFCYSRLRYSFNECAFAILWWKRLSLINVFHSYMYDMRNERESWFDDFGMRKDVNLMKHSISSRNRCTKFYFIFIILCMENICKHKQTSIPQRNTTKIELTHCDLGARVHYTHNSIHSKYWPPILI